MLWWNGLALLLVLGLLVYGKLAGMPAGALVAPPPGSQNLYVGFLTHAIQILCAVPFVACAFSFGLLRSLQPKQRHHFLFCSALLTGGFLANEMFRIHIILGGVLGIPKWCTILGYATILLVYAWFFRHHWRSTPYGLLIAAGCLFAVAFAMDSRLLGSGVSDLLEGAPKFFSILNMALYFWLVSRKAVLQSLSDSPILLH